MDGKGHGFVPFRRLSAVLLHAWLSFLPSLDFLLSRSIHMSVCLPAFLFVFVCLRVSICLRVSVSVCCLSACPSGSLSVSFCLSVSV